MSKRLMSVTLAFVVLGPALVHAAGLTPVGWWMLDDGAGTVAADSSSGGNPGAVMGDATWGKGKIEGDIEFDGANDYVDLPIGSLISSLSSSTFAIWANWSQSGGGWQRLFDFGTGTNVNMFLTPAIGGGTTGVMRFAITTSGSGGESQLSAPATLPTEWHHVAVAIDGDAMNMQLYLDGTSVATAATALLPTNLGNTTQNWLGRSQYSADGYYNGALDDFRIYNSVLSPTEIQTVMAGGGYGAGGNPNPADKATDVSRDTLLTWKPGRFASTHDVYLGLSGADVNDATTSNPLDVLVSQSQDANSFDPGRLELGRTYYWRVDEVNAAPDFTVYQGPVWSFTVESYSYPITGIIATASSANKGMDPERTVDGSGLNELDQHSTVADQMWLSAKGGEQPTWIQYEFDGVYKLDKMRVWNSNQALEGILGIGAKDVTVEYSSDGQTWTTLGDFEFAQAPGSPDYVGDISIDFAGVPARFVKLTINSNWGGVLAQYGLAEVRFYSVPVMAREPQPAADATEVNPQTPLTWRPGREADSHIVYVSEDQQAVVDGAAPAATVSGPAYEPSLLVGSTYYWKVTEVNDAEAISAWDGPVWSFSTSDFVPVDDFEAYTDDEGSRIYEYWIDGYDDPANGSLVGYGQAPFAERTVVHSGKQSMPLEYANTAGVSRSEATRTFASPQDWTQHGVTTLVLFFRGQPGNSPASLYLKINDTKVSFNNPAATTMALWKQWAVDLAASGANLQSVKSLSIGVEGSGTGMLFVDDIRLYAAAPEVATPADPGTTGLMAYYKFDSNVEDSSGKNYHGTLNNEAGYEPGVSGQALNFNGTSTYVDLPLGPLVNTLTSVTIATNVNFNGGTGAWQRIFDFGTGTTNYMFLAPRQGTAGAMRFAIRTATVTEQVVDGPAAMPLGWHHAAVTIDSAAMTLKLYLDAELVGEAPTTLLPKDLGATTQNWLGRSQWSADAYFFGMLDEFRIYNRVLSDAEVRYLAGDR